MILGGSLPAEAVHAIRRHDAVPCIPFVIQSAKIGNRNMRRDWRDQLHQTRSHKFGNFGVRISREPFGMSTLNAACQPDPHTHTLTLPILLISLIRTRSSQSILHALQPQGSPDIPLTLSK